MFEIMGHSPFLFIFFKKKMIPFNPQSSPGLIVIVAVILSSRISIVLISLYHMTFSRDINTYPFQVTADC